MGLPPGLRHRLIPGVTKEVSLRPHETSLVPPPPVPACRPPYAEEFFEAALPESSPLPWPSPSLERLGSPWSLAGEHHDAAGFPSWYGLLGCSSFSEGYSASAPSVTQEHWEPATWRSGAYHDRTCTGKQTVTCKAHQAIVRRGLASPIALLASCPYRDLPWQLPSRLLAVRLCHLVAVPAPRHAHHCLPG